MRTATQYPLSSTRTCTCSSTLTCTYTRKSSAETIFGTDPDEIAIRDLALFVGESLKSGECLLETSSLQRHAELLRTRGERP